MVPSSRERRKRIARFYRGAPLAPARVFIPKSVFLKIATFNINNVNKRLDNLLAWLAKAAARCRLPAGTQGRAAAPFPRSRLRALGYHAVWQGERSWNGVAILARDRDPVLTRSSLPGDPEDRQARYIEAAVNGVLIASLYLPNGNPQPGPKFDYKLAWFERLIAHAADLMTAGVPVVLAGDYNVVPTPQDIYPTRSLDNNALIQPESRAGLRAAAGSRLDRRSAASCSPTARSGLSGITSASAGRRQRHAARSFSALAGPAPIAWWTAVSTAGCAARKTPATTLPRGSSLIFPDALSLPIACRHAGRIWHHRRAMFFRREKPHVDTFQERLDALKQYGIAVQSEGAVKARVHRNGIGATVTDVPDDRPHITKAGLIVGDEIGALG